MGHPKMIRLMEHPKLIEARFVAEFPNQLAVLQADSEPDLVVLLQVLLVVVLAEVDFVVELAVLLLVQLQMVALLAVLLEMVHQKME